MLLLTLMMLTTTMPKTIDLKYQAYGDQHKFVVARQNFAALRGGIGSGKSVGGAIRAVLAACGQVGGRPIQTPNLGVVTAPTYTMLRDASLRVFEEVAGDLLNDFNKQEMRATLINGSEVLFRSTEKPDRLRGPSIAWCWLDEAAYYSDKVFPIMVGRLRQHSKLGHLWLTTTPKGRNWVYKEFVQNKRPNRVIFQLRSKDSPFLDPEIYEAWSETYVGDFAAQELEGEFITFEGLIYPEFDRRLHITTRIPQRFKTVIAGVDWGFTNPGVILVLGVDSDGRMWLIHEEYRRKTAIDEWANLAKQLKDLYKISTFYCDPSEPDYIAKFNEKGCTAVGADNTVTTGIQAVRARLIARTDGLPRLMIGERAVHTATEFEQYQWLEHRHGLREQPLKMNDHTMDALRYSILMFDEKAPEPVKVTVKKIA